MKNSPKPRTPARGPSAWRVGLFATACVIGPVVAHAETEPEIIATARVYAIDPAVAISPNAENPVSPNMEDPLAAPEIPAAPAPNPAQPTTPVPGAPRANKAAAAPPVVQRMFTFTPMVGVQETFTDNALLTSVNRRSDFITRGLIGFSSNFDDGPTQGVSTAQLSYDQYARNTALSGWSISAYGSGSYSLVPNLLTLEAAGTVTDGNVSEFGTPAIDRSGVAGRILLSTYDIGPHLTMKLASFADLDAIAHFSQVFYSAADASTVTQLPSNSSIFEIGAQADTGKRFAGYESITAADYEDDNHGFYTANALESVFVPLSPHLRLIGRAGYETDYVPPVADINAPILSAGLEYTPNERSKVSVEGGSRYNRAAWVASAYVQISDRLYLAADYQQVLEPDQLYIANAFVGFVQLQNATPNLVALPNFGVNGNLYNQPSLDTTADAHVIYQWPRQTLDIFVSWRDRDFLNNSSHDRTLIAEASLTRQLRPDLEASLSVAYSRTFESPTFVPSTQYNLAGQVVYNVNSTVDLAGGYSLDRQAQEGKNGLTIYENVAFIALRKHF
jgi:uncharacterized protein (PEP-CTERM system associated)